MLNEARREQARERQVGGRKGERDHDTCPGKGGLSRPPFSLYGSLWLIRSSSVCVVVVVVVVW